MLILFWWGYLWVNLITERRHRCALIHTDYFQSLLCNGDSSLAVPFE